MSDYDSDENSVGSGGDDDSEAVELGFAVPCTATNSTADKATTGGAGGGAGAGAGGGSSADDVDYEEDADDMPVSVSDSTHLNLNWDAWDGGKAGGVPVWLDPLAVPTRDAVLCSQCGSQMLFLLQVCVWQ